MNAPIDTLAFAEKFEVAGFAQDQARVLASAFGQTYDAAREGLVTKEYLDARLADVEGRLGAAIADVKIEVTKHLADSRIDLSRDIAQIGKDVQGRLWSTVAIIAGVSTAVSATIGAAMTLIVR